MSPSKISIALIALASLTACGGSSTAHKADWEGWARYEHATIAPDVSLAKIVADGKKDKLDDCPGGQVAADAFALEPAAAGDDFFLCGEAYTRDEVNRSDASARVKTTALALVGQLDARYGKH